MKTVAESTDELCADDTSSGLDEQSFGTCHDDVSTSSTDFTTSTPHACPFSNKRNISDCIKTSSPLHSCTTNSAFHGDSVRKTNLNPESRLQGHQQHKEYTSTESANSMTGIRTSFDELEENGEVPNVNNFPDLRKDCEVPEYIRLLEVAVKVNGDSKVPINSKPDWLDLEKLKRGQKFAQEYFFGLVFAEMLSLMLLFLHPGNLQPLIYTGKSDTPFKAFKRYLSTVLRISSWYESDLWKENSEGHKNLKIVRDMHQAIRRRISSTDSEEFEEKSSLKPPVWSTLNDKLREDLRLACPYIETGSFFCPMKDYVFINQAEMAGTQFGFIGLMILYPNAFGAARASEEDLDGFVHLWRCIGYLLGIDDRYNLCTGTLETVRQRSRDILEYVMKPKLRDIDSSWEHMYRCLVEGISYYVPGVSFEVSALYLFRLLGIYSPYLESSITYFQSFMYRVTFVVMYYLLQFPPYRAFNNWLLKMSIKKMATPSPSWIREHEQRVYPYQTQNCGAVYTRL